MSYDLAFYSKSKINQDKLFEFLKSLQIFKLSDKNFDKHCQFWYQNPETNVYFSFDLDKTKLDNELSFKGFFDTGLSFNMNFIRPSIFKEEAFPIVDMIVKKFNLFIVDPQGKNKPTKYSLKQLKESWELSNVKATKQFEKENGFKEDISNGYPLERKQINYIWRWQSNRNKMQDNVGKVGGVEFVPNIFIHLYKKRVTSFFSWSIDIPCYFPVTDKICVVFETKKIFGKSHTVKVFKWHDIFNLLKKKLKSINKNGLKYYVYDPKNYQDLISMLNKLEFTVLNKEFTRLSLDQLIDEEYLK